MTEEGPASTRPGESRPSSKRPAELKGQNRLLDAEQAIAGTGSWEWYPDSGEVRWSDNAFRLLGFEPGEVVPDLDVVLERTHPGDRDRQRRALARVGAGARQQWFGYRLIQPGEGARYLRSAVLAVEGTAARPRRVIGFVQDLTEQHEGERILHAHAVVSDALSTWATFADSVLALLERLAGALEFEAAAVWLPVGGRLECRGFWVAPPAEAADFEVVSRGVRPKRGNDVPGIAWQQLDPLIPGNFTDLLSPGRREAANRAEFRGAVAIPAVHAGEAFAVLEFYGYEPRESTERLRQGLKSIGLDMGRFLAGRRGELGMTELTRRERDVLQLAARGFGGRQIAEQLTISAGTVKTHFAHIYRKLGVADRAAAVATGLRQGLIE